MLNNKAGFPIHCTIHREHLFTKFSKYPDVLKTGLYIALNSISYVSFC